VSDIGNWPISEFKRLSPPEAEITELKPPEADTLTTIRKNFLPLSGQIFFRLWWAQLVYLYSLIESSQEEITPWTHQWNIFLFMITILSRNQISVSERYLSSSGYLRLKRLSPPQAVISASSGYLRLKRLSPPQAVISASGGDNRIETSRGGLSNYH